MGVKFSLNLCKKEFWNGFFSPRFPGVHIILMLVLLDTLYTCASVLMSTYFDNFSGLQHAGYLTVFLANMIVIVTGFLCIHFLTLKPAHMKLSYCIFLHVALITSMLLGILTVMLMLTPPPPNEIRDHTLRYVKIYHRAPYMMSNVMQELQCCGIQNFGDIFKEVDPSHVSESIREDGDNTKPEKVIFYRIPPSCCRAKNKDLFGKCEKWVEKLVSQSDFDEHKDEYLNQEPCLKKGENFSKLQSTSTYGVYQLTVGATLGTFGFILGILLVLNYYIWYRFPRMPEGQRPKQFNEDLRTCLKCKYSTLKKSLEENKKRIWADREAMLEGRKDAKKNVSEFALRHQMIMQSLQNMRAMNRQKEQEEKQLLVARSKSNLLMPAATPGKLTLPSPSKAQQISRSNVEYTEDAAKSTERDEK